MSISGAGGSALRESGTVHWLVLSLVLSVVLTVLVHAVVHAVPDLGDRIG